MVLTIVPPFSLKPVTRRLDRLGALKSGHSLGAHCTVITLSTGGAAAVSILASSPKATLSRLESPFGSEDFSCFAIFLQGGREGQLSTETLLSLSLSKLVLLLQTVPGKKLRQCCLSICTCMSTCIAHVSVNMAPTWQLYSSVNFRKTIRCALIRNDPRCARVARGLRF